MSGGEQRYGAMAQQFSDSLRNSWLDQIETTLGTSAILKIRTGAQPATVATADSGTVLATITLPADWASAAASGVKSKSGTWSDASADATGTAAHWRLYTSGGTAHAQGTCTVTGGGGDLTLDSVSITAAQVVSVTSWAWTAPGA